MPRRQPLAAHGTTTWALNLPPHSRGPLEHTAVQPCRGALKHFMSAMHAPSRRLRRRAHSPAKTLAPAPMPAAPAAPQLLTRSLPPPPPPPTQVQEHISAVLEPIAYECSRLFAGLEAKGAVAEPTSPVQVQSLTDRFQARRPPQQQQPRFQSAPERGPPRARPFRRHLASLPRHRHTRRCLGPSPTGALNPAPAPAAAPLPRPSRTCKWRPPSSPPSSSSGTSSAPT